nr:high mobility group B protein 6-like isoform X2 [Ipomoea batatas]
MQYLASTILASTEVLDNISVQDDSFCRWQRSQIVAKNKEQYVQEMEVYRKMEEEAASHKKEEEEMIKLKKQEAMQLLKKIEKTENIIKKKETKRKKQKEEKNVDPNRLKKPASSFLCSAKREGRR